MTSCSVTELQSLSNCYSRDWKCCLVNSELTSKSGSSVSETSSSSKSFMLSAIILSKSDAFTGPVNLEYTVYVVDFILEWFLSCLVCLFVLFDLTMFQQHSSYNTCKVSQLS